MSGTPRGLTATLNRRAPGVSEIGGYADDALGYRGYRNVATLDDVVARHRRGWHYSYGTLQGPRVKGLGGSC